MSTKGARTVAIQYVYVHSNILIVINSRTWQLDSTLMRQANEDSVRGNWSGCDRRKSWAWQRAGVVVANLWTWKSGQERRSGKTLPAVQSRSPKLLLGTWQLPFSLSSWYRHHHCSCHPPPCCKGRGRKLHHVTSWQVTWYDIIITHSMSSVSMASSSSSSSLS